MGRAKNQDLKNRDQWAAVENDAFWEEEDKEYKLQYYLLVYRFTYQKKIAWILTAICITYTLFGLFKTRNAFMLPAQVSILFYYHILGWLFRSKKFLQFRFGIQLYPLMATLSWLWQLYMYKNADRSILVGLITFWLICHWFLNYFPSFASALLNSLLCSGVFLAGMYFIDSTTIELNYWGGYTASMLTGIFMSTLLQAILKREFFLKTQNKQIKLFAKKIHEGEAERRVMLDNIPLGILSVEKYGDDIIMGKNYSRYLPVQIHSEINQYLKLKVFLKMIGLSAEASTLAINALEASFYEDPLVWELNCDHLPLKIKSENFSEPVFYRLSWTPRFGRNNMLESIFVTITDETMIESLHQAAVTSDLKLKIVGEIIENDPRSLRSFFRDSAKCINELGEVFEESEFEITNYFRQRLHTLKGNARALRMSTLTNYIHQLEDDLEAVAARNSFNDMKMLFRLYQSIEEDVFGRARNEEETRIPTAELRSIVTSGDVSAIKQYILKPAAHFLMDLRAVRDAALLAERNDRFLKIRIIEDRAHFIDIKHTAMFESIFAHLVANSIAHGIEPRQEREILGKAVTGVFTIHVQKGTLTVSDDGAGINVAALRDANPINIADDEEFVNAVLFESGFSTSLDVTNLAGRGMGLAAIKEMTESFGGSVRINLGRLNPIPQIHFVFNFSSVIDQERREGSELKAEWELDNGIVLKSLE